jgi:ppGpp synthetase/RelA/SpoT-type nucleotidyltranferase
LPSAQDAAVEQLKSTLAEVRGIDRRQNPSHGYRAVHLVASHHSRGVEVQVRTAIQDVWAGLCEKLSDTVDRSIKYGGGPSRIQQLLRFTSEQTVVMEDTQVKVGKIRPALAAEMVHGDRMIFEQFCRDIIEQVRTDEGRPPCSS